MNDTEALVLKPVLMPEGKSMVANRAGATCQLGLMVVFLVLVGLVDRVAPAEGQEDIVYYITTETLSEVNLTKGTWIAQGFTATLNHLDRFTLWVSTQNLSLTSGLRFHVKSSVDSPDDLAVADGHVRIEDPPFFTWVTLVADFNTPLEVGKKYFMVVEDPLAPASGHVWSAGLDATADSGSGCDILPSCLFYPGAPWVEYLGGEAYVNGVIYVNGDFLFTAVMSDAPEPDTDGDSIPDDQDECPDSDLSATVVIDACDSKVPNGLFPSGCTISDLIAECAEGAHNRGRFVSCVSDLTDDLKEAGTIMGQQKGAIQSCAARANVP
jgi:hypothetical protein